MSIFPFRLFSPSLGAGSVLPLSGILFLAALPFAEAGGSAPQRPLRILAFGDSLVAGFAVSSKAAFPVRLEKSLRIMGFDVEVINAGLPGDTTTGGLARLERALEWGTNDNLQGFDPALTEANLDAMLTRIRERNIAVLLTGIAPLRDLGPDYRSSFISIFSRLAAKHQVPLYTDFLEGVAGRPELNKADGIHPNPKGIDEIVRRVAPLVGEVLERLLGSLDRS
jgi:acyl-CoA thioesterase-1